jgi:hypothetical protein
VEARRLLKEIADSVKIAPLTSGVSDQPAFAATARSSFVFPGDQPVASKYAPYYRQSGSDRLAVESINSGTL